MSRFNNITLVLILAVVTVMALFGVRRIQTELDNTVTEEKLRFSGEVSDAPPAVAFTTMALGSFRGLIADFLWLRSEMLKSKKNYFEMVQLARWITDLQPNYSAGTAYLAWNLAYNISVTSSSWEDRWYWVNEGLKLIRDKAMTYNPDDPLLYKELAWIYLHKLGNLMDDAHLYYKVQMANEMFHVLGGKTEDFARLAAAPANKEEFLKKYPEKDPIWAKLKKSGINNYDDLFNAFRKGNRQEDDKNVVIYAELPNALRLDLTAAEFDALDAFLRAELLRTEFKLEPAKMLAIDNKYGRMDWRVPESQAIYWAEEGVNKSRANGREPDVNCVRIVSHGLQAAFKSGTIYPGAPGEPPTIGPNLQLAVSAYKAFENAEEEYNASGAGLSFRSAKINFLKDAIPLLYIYLEDSSSRLLFDELVKIDGPQKGKDFADFIRIELTEDVRDADWKKIQAVVGGLIRRGMFELLSDKRDNALRHWDMAAQFYKIYVDDNKDVKRNQMPEFTSLLDEFVKNTFINELSPDAQRKWAAIMAEEQARREAEAATENKNGETSAM